MSANNPMADGGASTAASADATAKGDAKASPKPVAAGAESGRASASAAGAKPGPAASAAGSLRPVLVLVTICAVAGVLLGFVHQMTAPVIEAAEVRRAEETYAELVPEAATFEDVPCDVEGCTAALRAADASGVTLGYVVVAEARGYGGAVPLAVAFDGTGTVTSVAVMPNDETPGLGSRISESSYISQYVGLSAQAQDDTTVDLISGATISSRAALNAFNRAVEAYEEVCS